MVYESGNNEFKASIFLASEVSAKAPRSLHTGGGGWCNKLEQEQTKNKNKNKTNMHKNVENSLLMYLYGQNWHRTRVGGLNFDPVSNYFEVLAKAIADVEQKNGHPLRGDETLNVDETGFDLCSCTKTQRVVIRCTQYKKQPKAMHEGSADRSHFAAAVCIDASGNATNHTFATQVEQT